MRLAIALLLLTSVARADGVDWSTGLVTAKGFGVANRAAPSPAAARGPARRVAEEAARAAVDKLARALPVASGGTVATALADAAVKTRYDAALAAALVIDAEPQTDGSWRVTLGLPVEAIRQAIAGPRTVAATGDTGPAVAIVEGVKAKPAIGMRVGTLAPATRWVTAIPAWAKDAPRTKAKGVANGSITADIPGATAATLVLLVP